jgi:hypothetical protein
MMIYSSAGLTGVVSRILVSLTSLVGQAKGPGAGSQTFPLYDLAMGMILPDSFLRNISHSIFGEEVAMFIVPGVRV